MNRRSFLTGLATLIGGSALDPERLLWVPGKKLISIPSGESWVIPHLVTNEMLASVSSNLIAGRSLFNPDMPIYQLYDQHLMHLLESIARMRRQRFITHLGT